MKRSIFVIVLSLFFGGIGFSSSALAQVPVENVTLGVVFDVSKCSQSNTVGMCDSSLSALKNVLIPLSTCSEQNGLRFCHGEWEESITRDGYAFDASISIIKVTMEYGSSVYTMNSSVGPTLNSVVLHSRISVLMNDGKLTNSIVFSSAALNVGQAANGDIVSYVPYLSLSPAQPIPPKP
ncbi:MAG: hypothetical protein AABY64_06560 [Bdellovibrionota bacterium]